MRFRLEQWQNESETIVLILHSLPMGAFKKGEFKMGKRFFLLLVWSFSMQVNASIQVKEPNPVPAATLERPPQFVLISFDGSYSDQFWKESFNLADKANAKFSYFVSGVYFIEHNDNKLYQGPDHSLGVSDIGFGDNSLADLSTRTENVWQALQKNFDIGSHVNGHFDGTKWSEAQWTSEFTQFHKFVERVFSIYPGIKENFSSQWEQKMKSEIKGFRAPLLAESPGVAATLEKFNYLYDSSKVLNSQWPYQMNDGIWNVGLSEVELAGSGRRTIAMDYNLLYGQCDGKFNPKNGGECANLTDAVLAHDQDQTYRTYIQAFLKSYYGNRSPISIGHHFSLFNRGIYWMALQKFTYAVCNQPEVKCVTHSEMIKWLEAQKQARGANYLTALNKGQFDQRTTLSSVRQALALPLAVAPVQVAAKDLQTNLSLTSDTEMASDDILNAVSARPIDEVQAQMLKGDLPGAHMFDHEVMDLESARYEPSNERANR